MSLGTTVCPNDGTALAPECQIGSKFADKYVLTALIGKGGMSAVYTGTDTMLGRTVAIKLLHQYLAQDSVAMKRFRQEARTISQLNHPGIVRIHEFGILDHGQPYIVMDYLQGMSMAQLIKRHGVARPKDAIELFKQITRALAHAHLHGVLHRDLKPSNVMLAATESGDDLNVTLVDFGIAKVATEDDVGRLTATGEVIGSPVYMSPEQSRGMALDERSDLYSLGCLMYEAITGKTVVWGENALDILFNKMHEDPVPLADAAEGVTEIPEALDAIVTKLIQRKPEDRYQSAQELLQDLETIDTPELAVARASRRGKKKKPANKSLIGKLVAAGIAGAIASVAAYTYISTQVATSSKTSPAVHRVPHVPDTLSPTDESLRTGWQRMLNQQKLYLNKTQVTDFGLNFVALILPLQELNLNSTAVKNLSPLQKLRYLQQLDVGTTGVNDKSLPPIVKLPLRQLIVANDDITDQGVKTIAQIKTLDHLDVAGTNITDNAAGILATLPNLHVWILDRTKITDAFAERMPTEQPTYLALNSTGLTNKGLLQLTSRLPNLQGVSFGDSATDDKSVDILCSVRNLHQVYLNKTCANDTTVKKFSQLKHLETLGLDEGSISSAGVEHLKQTPSLQQLQLNYDQISDATVHTISSLHGLHSLSLVGNPITDASLPDIAKLTNLTSLDLSDTKITADRLTALRPLKQLQSIRLQKLGMTYAQVKQFHEDHPYCLIAQ
ncbi:MAG TPA: protein kinase [Candidatus Obscuribacterales bacterium]